MHFFRNFLVVILATFALSGCLNTTEPAPFIESMGTLEQPLSGMLEMTIKDFHHHPNEIVAKQGTVIHVTNLDDSGQSLLSDDKSLDTGILGQNESADVTLNNLGKFVFQSEPYSNATGTIMVVQ